MDSNIEKLRNECDALGIEWDTNKRWENGIAHHPEAERIMELLKNSDWIFGDDYFDWNVGGDGDNGETLMYSLSVLLELHDARNRQTEHGFSGTSDMVAWRTFAEEYKRHTGKELRNDEADGPSAYFYFKLGRLYELKQKNIQ